VGVTREQRSCGHDLTRLAVAALHHLQIEPGSLDLSTGVRGADGFDGRDDASPMLLTGVTQERMATPFRWTVQAPHRAIPQPNFVPVMPSTSRKTTVAAYRRQRRRDAPRR